MRSRLIQIAVVCGLVLATVASSSASAAPAGSTLLVSRPDGLGPVPAALDNNSTTPGALSDDGRYAVFVSDADGLAPGADPLVQNVFVRDRQTGTTTLVSRSNGADGVGANADSSNPAITVDDAHDVFVAFQTEATNLSDQTTGPVLNTPGVSEVWLRNVTAGTTVLVSRATTSAGAPADQPARNPAVAPSAGGPLVVFDSQATNLGATGVLLRTVDAGVTQQVSCPHSDCAHPGISPSEAPDIRIVPGNVGLCSNNTFNLPCVHVAFESSDRTIFDTPNSQIALATALAPIAEGLNPTPFKCCNDLSINGLNNANAPSAAPSFSGDGQAVAFVSGASNLGGNPPPGTPQAYVRGLHGPTLLLSKATAGDAANRDVFSVALAGTVTSLSTLAGLRAVFETSATNLPGTNNQAYVHDVGAGTTSLINRAAGPGGVPGNQFSSTPTISGDGTTALFATASSNLGDGKVDRFEGVHARQLTSVGQELELVSRSSGSGPLVASGSDESSLGSGSFVSANGRYVAFQSQSDSLSADDDDRSTNVFVRDLLTGATVLVNRASGANGVAGDADALVGGISADGRRVVFSSSSRNLSVEANGLQQVYVRDLDASTTTLASRSDGGAGPVAANGALAEAISADGNAVAVTSASPLDAAGADGFNHVYVRDLAAQTTTLADRDNGDAGAVPAVGSRSAVIDADGGRVAWATRATLADAPADGKEHVYLRDLRSHVTTLVSRATGAAGPSADGNSNSPAINAGGDVIAFTSASPNLGASLSATQVFVRDIAAAQTELVSRRPEGPLLPANAHSPSIDAAGDRISFLAAGASDSVSPFATQAFVRDRHDQVTIPVSLANGTEGAPADGSARAASIAASGDCVAFAGRFTNLDDGFASFDFNSVHLRVLRNECPAQEAAPAPGSGPGTEPGVGPGAGPGTTSVAATLSRLAVAPKRFHVAGRKRGTTIRFRLSKASRVSVRLVRLAPGHRNGKACRTGGRGKRCTITAKAGTFTLNAHAGANRVRFSGKLKGKALRVGRYRLTATPAKGKPHTVPFTVIAAPKTKKR